MNIKIKELKKFGGEELVAKFKKGEFKKWGDIAPLIKEFSKCKSFKGDFIVLNNGNIFHFPQDKKSLTIEPFGLTDKAEISRMRDNIISEERYATYSDIGEFVINGVSFSAGGDGHKKVIVRQIKDDGVPFCSLQLKEPSAFRQHYADNMRLALYDCEPNGKSLEFKKAHFIIADNIIIIGIKGGELCR